MTLPHCPGWGDGPDDWLDECHDCLHRTAPKDGEVIQPPQIITFWCENYLPPPACNPSMTEQSVDKPVTPPSESTSITVIKIRDADGAPTCRWWEKVCPFLMTSGFGTREHCYWLDGEARYRPLLERRESGLGTTIPHSYCPVWEAPQ